MYVISATSPPEVASSHPAWVSVLQSGPEYKAIPMIMVGPGGALREDENVIQAIVRETMEETNVKVQPKQVVIIEDLNCKNFKMIKIWMSCEVVEGNICRTNGAEKEGIIQAAWYTKNQLTGEVVYPPPLIQNDWDLLRSENWKVECLPTRKANL